MYDFHKTKDASGKVFFHPNFIRDQKHLLKQIKRKATTNTITEPVAQGETENITQPKSSGNSTANIASTHEINAFVFLI